MFAPANIIQPNRFTNCLLDRVYLRVRPNSNSVPVFQNNLMYGGQFDPDWPSHGAVTNIVFRDNLFDHFAGPNSFSYYHNMDHNAYVTNASFPPPTPVDAGDLLLSNSPAYQTGALGVFYQPTNSPLIDAGSDTVSNVGLAGFTTQTSQIPDTGTVDIGYHYATFLQLTAQCRFDQIVLSWTITSLIQQAVADYTIAIVDFNIYRSTNHGGPYTLIGTTEENELITNYVDVAVATNTTYYYVVTLQYYTYFTGITDESPYSGEASASPCSLPAPIRPGFDQNIIGPNDDDSYNSDGFDPSQVVTNLLANIGFPVNFFGTTYTNLYVNCNGNVTFGNYLPDYEIESLVDLATNIIAPFWADVDTRGANSGLVTYGTNTVNGNLAFAASWINVGYYQSEDDRLNAFQLVLINRPDRTNGDYDVEFNYAKIDWDEGDATSGYNDGLSSTNTSPARAGYASVNGLAFELNGSGVSRAFLDTNLVTGLIYTNYNSGGVLGRYVYPFHNGTNALAHP